MDDNNNLTPEEIEQLEREEAQKNTEPSFGDRISNAKNTYDNVNKIKKIIEERKLKNASDVSRASQSASTATETGATAGSTASTATGTSAAGTGASAATGAGTTAAGAGTTAAAGAGASACRCWSRGNSSRWSRSNSCRCYSCRVDNINRYWGCYIIVRFSIIFKFTLL